MFILFTNTQVNSILYFYFPHFTAFTALFHTYGNICEVQSLTLIDNLQINRESFSFFMIINWDLLARSKETDKTGDIKLYKSIR